jgi:hypothetical protein
MRPLARLTITMMSSRITVPTVTVVGQVRWRDGQPRFRPAAHRDLQQT